MFFKKNIISLSILSSVWALSSCSFCDCKNDITLYPQDTTTNIRFPLNKGEASVDIALSYSLSEKRDCELRRDLGDQYADELIVGHTRQAVGERLQYKKMTHILQSKEWQEKKLTQELKHYFSCFDIDIFSVELNNLRREPDCILKYSPVLAPGCYDYTGIFKERE